MLKGNEVGPKIPRSYSFEPPETGVIGVTPPFVKTCTLRTENTRRTRVNPSSLE